MKKITAVLLSALFVLLASACGGENASSEHAFLPSSSLPSSPSSKDDSSSSPSDISSGQVSRPESKPEGDREQDIIPAPENTPHKNHYAYSLLTNVQKVYYEAMHTAVEEMHPSWIVLGPRTDSYTTDVAVVRGALIADHPDNFWLPHYYVTATGADGEGNLTALMMFSSSLELSPAYLVTRSEKAYMEAELERAVEEITSLVTATEPFEIELQLHDLLCQRVSYSDDKNDEMIYTAYGALVNGKAICEGYTRAMQLLLSKFGILSTTVSGVAENEGHMWNLVNIDGNWYHLDVTWNDADGFISHEYFNITDSEISLDHTFSKDYTELLSEELSGGMAFNISKPPCTESAADYFVNKGLIFDVGKTEELAEQIAVSPDDIIEVKFANTDAKKDFTVNTSLYVDEINAQIAQKHPEADCYIGRVSVSSLTLKLYKEQKEDSAEAESSF